jgi:hypothetical protein
MFYPGVAFVRPSRQVFLFFAILSLFSSALCSCNTATYAGTTSFTKDTTFMSVLLRITNTAASDVDDDSAEVAGYCVLTDKLSVLRVSDGGNNALLFENSASKLYVDVYYTDANGDVVSVSSPGAQYSNETYYVALRTAIITLTDGVPTGIAWDNRIGCVDTCTSTDDACIDSYCGVAYETDAATCTADDCDPRVMIAFDGTDAAGSYLVSQASTLYNFRRNAIGGTLQELELAVLAIT